MTEAERKTAVKSTSKTVSKTTTTSPSIDDELAEQLKEQQKKTFEEIRERQQAEFESMLAEINEQKAQNPTPTTTQPVFELFPEVDTPNPEYPTYNSEFEGSNWAGYDYPSVNDF